MIAWRSLDTDSASEALPSASRRLGAGVGAGDAVGGAARRLFRRPLASAQVFEAPEPDSGLQRPVDAGVGSPVLLITGGPTDAPARER